MTFSMFAVLMIVIVLLVAFIHMLQGVFSAAISAVLAVFSAVLALSYHEVIVEKYLGGRMADSAHAMMLVVLFAAIYLVLRTLFDSFVPGNIRLPAVADKVGGAALGAVAGLFGAGVVAVAAQEMSFFPSMIGYARYDVDSTDVTVPGSGPKRGQDTTVTDQMTAPEFNESDMHKLMLPVDDMLVDMTRHLSEGGALSSEPLSHLHPDWLQELFGQRLGIEPGGRRVLLAMPSYKTREAYTDGVYLITEPELPWIDAEFAEIRKATKPKVRSKPTSGPAPAAGGASGAEAKAPPEFYSPKPGCVLLVVRVRFNHEAAEKNAGGFVRVSPGSVRLVTPTDGKPPGEAAGYADHYPVGTLEYRDQRNEKNHPRLRRFVMIGQNVDDFIFVPTEPDAAEGNPNGTESAGDSAVDFVYNIPQPELNLHLPPGQVSAAEVVKNDLKLPQGSFIEIKRLAREDLSGQKILPESELYKNQDAVRVLRKPLEMKRGLESMGIPAPGEAATDSSSAAAPPTPAAPTPPPTTPEPAPAPAQAAFPLDVSDPPDSKVSDRFYTAVGSGGAEGPVNVTGGAFTLAKPADKLVIQTAKVDGADSRALRSGGTTPVIDLATPSGTSLVQIIGKPKEGAADKTWPWKDQLASLSLVDADNASYPLIGVWAQYTDPADGTNKIVARYSADGSVPVTDLQPRGELKQVWLAFAVKSGAKVKRLMLGSQPVKDEPIDVP